MEFSLTQMVVGLAFLALFAGCVVMTITHGTNGFKSKDNDNDNDQIDWI